MKILIIAICFVCSCSFCKSQGPENNTRKSEATVNPFEKIYYEGREVKPYLIEIRNDTIYSKRPYIDTLRFKEEIETLLFNTYDFELVNNDTSKVLAIKVQFDNSQATEMIVNVMSIIRSSYEDFWDKVAYSQYSKPYANLTREEKNRITMKAPYLVSSATPVGFD